MFPEGRIKQEALHELRRFKWGVSRILMEVKELPLVIPIWIQGKPSDPILPQVYLDSVTHRTLRSPPQASTRS